MNGGGVQSVTIGEEGGEEGMDARKRKKRSENMKVTLRKYRRQSMFENDSDLIRREDERVFLFT